MPMQRIGYGALARRVGVAAGGAMPCCGAGAWPRLVPAAPGSRCARRRQGMAWKRLGPVPW